MNHADLLMDATLKAPAPTKCPHCGSLECGPVRCRFTMQPREFHDFRDTPKQYGPEYDRDLVGRPLKAGT